MLVAFIITTAALFLNAAPASAAELMLREGRGDMWRVDFNEKSGEEYRPAPAVRNGDAIRVLIRHTATHVVIREKFVALRRTGDLLMVGAEIRTNEGVRRDAFIFADRRNWQGDAIFSGPRGQGTDCDLEHSLNYATNTAVIKIPRTCLSNPRWVQVRLGDGFLKRQAFFIDNPHNGQAEPKAWTARIRKG